MRLLDEALAAGLALEAILYAPERLAATAAGRALRHQLERRPEAEEVDERALASVSDTVTSQGVVAAAHVPPPAPLPAEGHVLLLDGIADPGNAGTMVRTALAAGAAGVAATRTTTDLWGPKAVRAGMGAHFRLPVLEDVPDLAALGQRQLVLASAQDGEPYWEIDWSRPSAIVIGSEAHGPSLAAASQASVVATIPMAPGAESLNAAAAAAVLLFAASRERELTSHD